jgi:hypothetical protein
MERKNDRFDNLSKGFLQLLHAGNGKQQPQTSTFVCLYFRFPGFFSQKPISLWGSLASV